MLGGGSGKLAVDVMGMHVGLGPWRGVVGGASCWMGQSISYLFLQGARDGRMEEKVIRRDGVRGEETDGHVVVTNTRQGEWHGAHDDDDDDAILGSPNPHCHCCFVNLCMRLCPAVQVKLSPSNEPSQSKGAQNVGILKFWGAWTQIWVSWRLHIQHVLMCTWVLSTHPGEGWWKHRIW